MREGDIHTGRSASRGLRGGWGWGGSLSNVAGERPAGERRIWREDTHTCPAAQVADCEAGSGGATGKRVYGRFLPALLWDGSLSNVAGEDIHTCPAAQVADCEAGSGGGNGGTCVRPFPPALLCGGSLSNVAGERPRERKSLTARRGGGHGGTIFRPPPGDGSKRSEGPESRRECVREERRLDQATRTGPGAAIKRSIK